MQGVEAVGSRQSAVEVWEARLAAEAEARRRERAESRVRELVTMHLALDALAMPVGERLGISHFALSSSVSPLALAAGMAGKA